MSDIVSRSEIHDILVMCAPRGKVAQNPSQGLIKQLRDDSMTSLGAKMLGIQTPPFMDMCAEGPLEQTHYPIVGPESLCEQILKISFQQ